MFVGELDDLMIIGIKDKAHEMSFAVGQACSHIIINTRIFRSV